MKYIAALCRRLGFAYVTPVTRTAATVMLDDLTKRLSSK